MSNGGRFYDQIILEPPQGHTRPRRRSSAGDCSERNSHANNRSDQCTTSHQRTDGRSDHCPDDSFAKCPNHPANFSALNLSGR